MPPPVCVYISLTAVTCRNGTSRNSFDPTGNVSGQPAIIVNCGLAVNRHNLPNLDQIPLCQT